LTTVKAPFDASGHEWTLIASGDAHGEANMLVDRDSLARFNDRRRPA
jgi:hypothetical protein